MILSGHNSVLLPLPLFPHVKSCAFTLGELDFPAFFQNSITFSPSFFAKRTSVTTSVYTSPTRSSKRDKCIQLSRLENRNLPVLPSLSRLHAWNPACRPFRGEKLLKNEIDLRSFCHRIILTGEFWSGFFSATSASSCKILGIFPALPNRSKPNGTQRDSTAPNRTMIF